MESFHNPKNILSKIIITSGPTREWIDPVRYISNASSGKMGHSIGTVCIQNKKNSFQDLVYIAGYTEPQYKTISGAKNLSVGTTLEMLDAILSELESNTLLIMAAAPVDFRPKIQLTKKIKRKEQGQTLIIELQENPDILTTVSYHIQENRLVNVIRIGFAAETHNLDEHAIEKLRKKKLDWILANSVGDGKGFGEVENLLHCYSKDGENFRLGPLSKEELAVKVWEKVLLPYIHISRS